jgi:hypothetical protein
MVDVQPDGNPSATNFGGGFGDVLSSDGHHVAFVTWQGDLVAPTTASPGTPQVFERDLETGKTELVSHAADGSAGADLPSISGDGRWVTFYQSGAGAVSPDQANQQGLLLHDMSTGETTLIAEKVVEGKITSDGRYVFWRGDGLTIWDRETGQTKTFGPSPNLTELMVIGISDDASIVAFADQPDTMTVEAFDRTSGRLTKFDTVEMFSGLGFSGDGNYVGYYTKDSTRLGVSRKNAFTVVCQVKQNHCFIASDPT